MQKRCFRIDASWLAHEVNKIIIDWIYISFGIISIFGTSPAWQSSKLTFAWNAVGRSSFGEVDHGRRQKPLPAMRACEQKQNPMLWFVWRVRQLQRWAALFLSMAGRSCLLRYSWFGENSNVFKRRVVCFIKKNAPTKPSADGWWGRGAPSGVDSTHRILYHRVRVCQSQNKSVRREVARDERD